MWTVVYVSQNEDTAKRLVEILRKHSILSRMRRMGQKSGRQGFEVLVPKPEIDGAQNIIIDNELF